MNGYLTTGIVMGAIAGVGGTGMVLKFFHSRISVVEANQTAVCPEHKKVIGNLNKMDELLRGSEVDPSQKGLVGMVQEVKRTVNEIRKHQKDGE